MIQLSAKQRAALPDTFGIPPYENYVLRIDAQRQKEEPTYSLGFEEVTQELETALNIGLENYGSGAASYRLCEIVKGTKTMNKHAALFQLYVNQVCGAQHTTLSINTAWRNYTPEQREYITKHIESYHDSVVGYLQENF